MSNWNRVSIVLSGEGREAVAAMFETPDVANEWFRQKFNANRCYDPGFKDDNLDPDRIVILRECAWSPPLALIQEVSEHYPDLIIEVEGSDPMNETYERWIFTDGEADLMDCSAGQRGEGDDIVYISNGKQLRKLPRWVAAYDDPEFESSESPKQSVEKCSSEMTELTTKELTEDEAGIDNEFLQNQKG